MILEFNSGIGIKARAVANFRDDIKIFYLTRSGVTIAIAMLGDDDKTDQDYDALNESWTRKQPPIPFGGGLVSAEITDEGLDNETYNKVHKFLTVAPNNEK